MKIWHNTCHFTVSSLFWNARSKQPWVEAPAQRENKMQHLSGGKGLQNKLTDTQPWLITYFKLFATVVANIAYSHEIQPNSFCRVSVGLLLHATPFRWLFNEFYTLLVFIYISIYAIYLETTTVWDNKYNLTISNIVVAVLLLIDANDTHWFRAELEQRGRVTD